MTSVTSTREPWGPWLTLALGGAIFILYTGAQVMGMAPRLVLAAMAGTPSEKLPQLVYEGLNLSIALLTGLPVMLLACGGLASLRAGIPIQEYLAIYPVRLRTLAGWTAVMILTALALSTLNNHFDRVPPEFVIHSVRTAGYPPLFWCAIGIAAPLAEEVFCRGFLYKGLAASRIGPPGAILVTSLLFMILHAGQYDWVDLVQVGLAGLLFGVARARTGSILPPVAMHMGLNFTSLVLLFIEDRV